MYCSLLVDERTKPNRISRYTSCYFRGNPIQSMIQTKILHRFNCPKHCQKLSFSEGFDPWVRSSTMRYNMALRITINPWGSTDHSITIAWGANIALHHLQKKKKTLHFIMFRGGAFHRPTGNDVLRKPLWSSGCSVWAWNQLVESSSALLKINYALTLEGSNRSQKLCI